MAFGLELSLNFLADRLGLFDFAQASDHWEHHRDVATSGGAVNRAQLGLENVGLHQADTQGAHAHGWVFFLRQIEVVDLFVRANVQGADNDHLAIHGRGDLGIGLKLLFFSWWGAAP